MIYDMAINGHSLQNIQAELHRLGIKSPSGKDKWTRDVIDKTINNKKYLAHIITFEKFVEASIEKEARCRYIRSQLKGGIAGLLYNSIINAKGELSMNKSAIQNQLRYIIAKSSI